MNAARLIVLGVALAAGGVAAYLAAFSGGPKEIAAPAPQFDTVDVLIAKTDIGLGSAVTENEFQWQAWPAATSGGNYIRKVDRPNAIQDLAGSIARAPFIAGEPIRESRLIKANGSGYMAAILPAGMRAISTEISPETGAGGFILPNDHVDVILSRRDRAAERATGGAEAHSSETILTGVRVLAIDQTVEEKDGQRVVVGKTATLELSPRQAETLALSRQTGTLSLALRSLADANKASEIEEFTDKKAGINTVRYGVTSTTPAR